MMIWIPSDAHERLAELASILAAGLVRLSSPRARAGRYQIAERVREGSSPMPKPKSSQITENTRDFALDMRQNQSSHRRPSIAENFDV